MKKSVKRILSVVLVFLIMMEWGCNRQKTPDPGHPVVIDGLGRQVRVPENIDRIITNYGIAVHMVFALGEWEKLIGMDMPSQNNRFFNAIYPDLPTLVSVGSVIDMNIEKALSLKPDIFLVSGGNKKLVDQLDYLGLPVFGVIVENLDQLNHTMLNLGRLLNRQQTADRFIDFYNSTIDMVKRRTRGIPEDKRPMAFITGPVGMLSTCTSDMYQHDLIEVCGGKNAGAMLTGAVTPHGWAEISPEHLLRWNPDVILVVQYSTAKKKTILTDNRWKQINAIKNNTVYEFPSRLNPWDYPSPQAVLGIMWLAKTLHPDLFQDVDIIQKANVFYQTFYGKTFSELGGSV